MFSTHFSSKWLPGYELRYLINSPQGQLTLYYEPHCVYNKDFLEKERADIVITPVIKQLLPKFTLVSGQEDAIKLAKLLHAKYIACTLFLYLCWRTYLWLLYIFIDLSLFSRFIVPMRNGDLDGKGFLASIIQSEGTVESFKVCHLFTYRLHKFS